MNPTSSRSHMSEINRLLAATEDVSDAIQVLHNSNTSLFSSPLNQSSLGYRSSSSNDSASPDAFPDISAHHLRPIPETDRRFLLEPPQLLYENTSLCETPSSSFQTCRQSLEPSRSLFATSKPLFNRSRQMCVTPGSFETSNLLHENSQPFTTRVAFRSQIPIFGRKVLDDSTYFQSPSNSRQAISPPNKNLDFENSSSLWKAENSILFQQTSPNKVDSNQCSQKMFYELFPSDNDNYEYKQQQNIAVKTSPTSKYMNSTNTSQISCTRSPPSSDQRNLSFVTPFNPNSLNLMKNNALNLTETHNAISNIDHNASSNLGQSSSKAREDVKLKMCTFCRKNGETPMVYTSHTIKMKINHKFIVTCPILRSHICPACGASGDNAHTLTYCPVLRRNNNGIPLQSTTVTLKNTRIKSNGKRRF